MERKNSEIIKNAKRLNLALRKIQYAGLYTVEKLPTKKKFWMPKRATQRCRLDVCLKQNQCVEKLLPKIETIEKLE